MGRSVIENAVCGPEEKLDPSEVPLVDFVGEVKAPQTDSKSLLVFRTEDGSSVGVRLGEDGLRAMARQLSAHLEGDA